MFPHIDPDNLLQQAEEKVQKSKEKIIAALQGHAHEVNHDLKHDFIDILDPWSCTWNTIDIPNGTPYRFIYHDLGSVAFNKKCIVGLYAFQPL